MMYEIGSLIPTFSAGLLLGGIFFGGLWWTVRKLVDSDMSPVWFLASFLLRMGITLGGFYLCALGSWESLTACLLGFITARIIVTRLTKPSERPISGRQESSHAP